METNQNRELKLKLLEMMKWFHAFCANHSIRYYVLGGTMLGAARHGGFIPWDDDIDVGVISEDYMKLSELISKTDQKRYVFEWPETGAPDYYYSFAKLYDTSTTLVENTRNRIKRGIYLDIFPLVGMGDDVMEAKRRFDIIDRQFRYLLARRTGIRKGRSKLKNAAVYALRLIPDFVSRDTERLVRLNRMANELPFNEYKIGGNPFGAWRDREIMDNSIMGTPKLYKFEDMEVYGSEHADEYLTHLYGDWRKLPPEEKRISHHDYIELDLSRSYLDRG